MMRQTVTDFSHRYVRGQSTSIQASLLDSVCFCVSCYHTEAAIIFDAPALCVLKVVQG